MVLIFLFPPACRSFFLGYLAISSLHVSLPAVLHRTEIKMGLLKSASNRSVGIPRPAPSWCLFTQWTSQQGVTLPLSRRLFRKTPVNALPVMQLKWPLVVWFGQRNNCKGGLIRAEVFLGWFTCILQYISL